MPFWPVRRRTATEPSTETPPLEAPRPREPIRLYLDEGVVEGEIEVDGQRVSDMLNERSVLRVALAPPDEWMEISVASILLIAPPPVVPDPRRRLHRLRHRAALRIGPYRVVGTAHLPPGNSLDRSVLSRRGAFLPITDASIDAHLDSPLEDDVPVALVNIAHIRELADLHIRL